MRKRYRSNGRQPFAATAPNQVWAFDFMLDGFANGQTLKYLTVIDEFIKESLCIEASGSIHFMHLPGTARRFFARGGTSPSGY